jgi:hypothetical protein
LGAKSHLAAGLERTGVTSRALWAGLLAGPLAFAAAEFADYAFVQSTCARGSKWILVGITAAAMLVVAGALSTAIQSLRRAPDAAPLDGNAVPSLVRFMALLGVAGCGFFIVALIALFFPQAAFHDCR